MGTISMLMKAAMACLTVMLLAVPEQAASAQGERIIKVAMLHLELQYADLEHNAKLVDSGITLAAKHGADWVMTPELSHTGYRFDLKLGTDWIQPGPDQYVKRVQSLAKKHRLTVFLSHLERVEGRQHHKSNAQHDTEQYDEQTSSNVTASTLFNTMFVIDNHGKIIARHRKINTIPISESWSTAGDKAKVALVDQHQVGLLICADAWPSTHANSLKNQGADIILSSASWAPGEYGPGDAWEQRSKETKLPIFVNNRTGIERQFDLTKSTSVVSYQGERLFTHHSPDSQLLLIEWDTHTNTMISNKTYKLGL